MVRTHRVALLLATTCTSCGPLLGAAIDDCGSGGPGCGTPVLAGICSGPLAPGTSTDVVVSSIDDTGEVPDEVTSAVSSNETVLRVEPLSANGRLRLGALAIGEADLAIKASGWEGKSFTFHFVVAASDGGSPDAGAPGCIRRPDEQ